MKKFKRFLALLITTVICLSPITAKAGALTLEADLLTSEAGALTLEADSLSPEAETLTLEADLLTLEAETLTSDPDAGADPIPIYDYEDLMKMAEDPEGSYILENDIDCSGCEWSTLDFYGSFDGNNHALLNLKITKLSEAVRTTYDGNMIAYDTSFAGFFGVLENASVKNLIIKGIDVEVEASQDCFIGTLAGYMWNSTIDNCDISGEASLTVAAKMMGVGGIAGYGGNSSIVNSNADVTLICVDTDKENRDEQFMAGAYGAGFIDLDNDLVIVDGYDSDHGYVHDGGLVGMYILYEDFMNYEGYITNSRSEGMITFFEDNTNRRAYCSEYIGEVMNWTYEWGGCTSSFVRNEVFDYSTDLYPHTCENCDFTSLVTESTDTEYGYTLYTCASCGYSYKADFTPLSHNVSSWETITEATTESTGLRRGICADCQTAVYEKTPKLEPVVIQEVIEIEEKADQSSSENAAAAETADAAAATETKKSMKPWIFGAIGIILLAGVANIIKINISSKKKRKKKKK